MLASAVLAASLVLVPVPVKAHSSHCENIDGTTGIGDGVLLGAFDPFETFTVSTSGPPGDFSLTVRYFDADSQLGFESVQQARIGETLGHTFLSGWFTNIGELEAAYDDPLETGDVTWTFACAIDPNDDADGDGVPNGEDVFHDDPTEWSDNDGDGIGDNGDVDDDNDGQTDDFETECGSDPLDAASISPDADGDAFPDCVDLDDDNDGVPDVDDAFPFDPSEHSDFDNDGIGDNADLDDDNDGQTDSDEIACGSDPLDAASMSPDADEDGVPDCLDSSISGIKWQDTNGNGVQDAGEGPIPGVTIYIDLNFSGFLDSGEPSTVTDSAGTYRFDDLGTGFFVVTEDLPAGFVQTFPANDQPHGISLFSGVNAVANFGNQSVVTLGSIQGTKWEDTNGDTIFDANEPGLMDVEIYLDLDGDGLLDPGEPREVTDVNGDYTFSGLAAGNYTIREIVPTGYSQTFPTAPDEYQVTLGAGDAVTGIDFGNEPDAAPSGVISGTKWEDTNGNRVRDGGEPGLEGVEIYLDLDGDGLFDLSEPQEVTDVNGDYSFSGLVVGPYLVRELVPTGYTQTFPTGDGSHDLIIFNAGETLSGINFGNQPTGVVTIVVGESIVVGDTVQVRLPVTITVTEVVAVADNVTVSPSLLIQINESVAVSDDVAVRPPVIITISESVGVADQVAVRPPIEITISESVGVSDQVAVEPEDPNGDLDGDGIANSVDLLRLQASDFFSDVPLGGSTVGLITNRNGLDVSVVDAVESAKGVTVSTSATPSPVFANLSLCPEAMEAKLWSGTTATFTCGSLTVDLDEGLVTLITSDGAEIDVAGGSSVILRDDGTTVSIKVLVGTAVVRTDGLTIDLKAGDIMESPGDTTLDHDTDGLTTGEEGLTGTNPIVADTDGDGLVDGIDPTWLDQYVAKQPDNVFSHKLTGEKRLRLRIAALHHVIAVGERDDALEIIDALASKADGCGSEADNNDWIIDCDTQAEFNVLLALLKRNVAVMDLPEPPPEWD